jgi:hypothetical protein
MRVRALAVVCLLVIAGCTAPTGTTGPASPPDYDEDPLGWEDGYWHNSSVAVDTSDGANRSELRAVTSRAMARVEHLRGLEFTDSVSVEVISRGEFRSGGGVGGSYGEWDDQVWEAAFLVGEDTTADEAFDEVYGGSVAGYYASGRIVLVADDPDAVAVDRATLVHELVHALQAQQLNLGGPRNSFDGRKAVTSVVEGDANYVMDRYQERCEAEWDCIEQTPRVSGDRSYDMGLFLVTFLPYSEGPGLVSDLHDRGGWEAVNDAYENYPESTEQVIHPERYPDETPADVSVPDRSAADWERFDRGGETLGEGALYAAFWENGVIPEDHLRTDERRYNYSHPVTDGWAGDRVVPYRNGDDRGYVFRTEWDTTADARAFRDAYLDLLNEHAAEGVRENTYRVPGESAFDDAFRVVRDGRTVTVVNAPTVDDLDDVHADRNE